MLSKYEKGSILQYQNNNKYLVCDTLKKDDVLYLLVMKLEGEIKDEITIDYKKLVMFKVLENDETIVENDESTIREVYNLMLEKEKSQSKN